MLIITHEISFVKARKEQIMLKKEWKNILKNPLLIIVLCAIVLIPSIYSTLFLASMWDPYGNLDKLPVAVVNHDNPVSYEDSLIDVGNSLVDNLKENESLDFHFVDETVAEEGIRSGDYYMVITIPEDFSKKAITLMDDTPEQMVLSYETNPGTNYIASKLSNTALAKIQESVANEVTRTYAKTVFEKLAIIEKGLEHGAKGALELKDGTQKLIDGNQTLTENLKFLSEQTLAFQDGSHTFYEGLSEYTSGVSKLTDGAITLQSGSEQLLTGSYQLNQGAQSLAKGSKNLSDATSSLSEGASNLQAGMTQLTKGGESLTEGTDQLKTGMEAYIKGVNTLQENAKKIAMIENQELRNAYMQALLKGFEDLTMQNDALLLGATSLQEGNQTLTNGLSGLSQGVDTLLDGCNKLDAGASALTEGASTLATGSEDLYLGMQSLHDGIDTLEEGASTLYSNNETLLSGADTLCESAGKMHEGVSKLADGSASLEEGLVQLQDGTVTLNSALNDGAKRIQVNQASDATLDMFSNPVSSVETQISAVNDNGSAMSAYMMCVGLWVGCLAFCLMYPLTKYSDSVKNGISWWFSKASVAYPLAALMAFVMFGILHITCGYAPADWKCMLIIGILASITFMSIMYFFNVAFGKIGSFLMLIFMVVQLSGSAGTYPIELSAGFVKKIHDYLPFSYVVEAFRVGICGAGSITKAIWVLLAWTLVFTVLTILLFLLRTSRIRNGKETLHDCLEHHGLA